MKVLKKIGAFGKKVPEKASNTAGDMGRGLLAGFIGTIAITAAQTIEMKITERAPSDTPVKAAGKVIGFEPKGEGDEENRNSERLNNMIHFTYGTMWGEVRALISSFGLKGWLATGLHFGAVWAAAMVMLPALKVAPPVKEWGAGVIAIDGLFHAVYAVATGLVYDVTGEHAC